MQYFQHKFYSMGRNKCQLCNTDHSLAPGPASWVPSFLYVFAREIPEQKAES